jgi:hypothetical protein
LDELARIHEAKIFEGLSAEDLEKLNALLDSISGNLSAFRGQRERAVAK